MEKGKFEKKKRKWARNLKGNFVILNDDDVTKRAKILRSRVTLGER